MYRSGLLCASLLLIDVIVTVLPQSLRRELIHEGILVTLAHTCNPDPTPRNSINYQYRADRQLPPLLHIDPTPALAEELLEAAEHDKVEIISIPPVEENIPPHISNKPVVESSPLLVRNRVFFRWVKHHQYV